jgi:hypothetical protein
MGAAGGLQKEGRRFLMNMFTIKTVEEIKNEIIGGGKGGHNFPKTIDFPFDELYKSIVTKIKTVELSPECILYGSVEAVNVSKEFSDRSYWNINVGEDEIKNYWFIGSDGQGNCWLMDKANKIYFYDHDLEEMSANNFIDLNIDFGQWLQFAYLDKEFSAFFNEDNYNENAVREYMAKLGEISRGLMENYPYMEFFNASGDEIIFS